MVQLDKRRDKLLNFNFGDHWAEISGQGELAVITWGSTAGAVYEARERLRADGGDFRIVSIRLLLPVQAEKLAAALDGVSRVLTVEQTHSGQFATYLRAHYDLPGEVRSCAKPGPLMLRADDILETIADWS